MDNALVGSSSGKRGGGLTPLGREAIAALEADSIIVDLAHMSARALDEALPKLKRPFALSHTALSDLSSAQSRWRRYSAATRNVPATVVREIGKRGGLVGIVLSTQLLGGKQLDAAVRSIALAFESAGNDHVCLGSDMDGALQTIVDVEGLPALASGMLESGVSASSVEGFLGTNAVDFLRRALPSG
jgi:membrane dipeptidase